MSNRFLMRVLDRIRENAKRPFCTIVEGGCSKLLTWSDLGEDCSRFMRLYEAHGLREGDQVLIFLEFGRHLYGAFLGAMARGIVPSFMPTLSSRQDAIIFWSSHSELLEKLQPAGILSTARVFSEMKAAGLELGKAANMRLEDVLDPGQDLWHIVPTDCIAFLQHSSGTTGLKKGVALTYSALTGQLESYARALDLNGSEQIVSWLPLYHDMGLVACFMLPMYLGLPIHHIDPQHWVARPKVLLDALDRRENALVWMPNFAFEHLAMTVGRSGGGRSWDLSGVKAFINCSEPCKPRSFDRFMEVFGGAGVRPEHLQCCYAMAETTFAASQSVLGSVPLRVKVDPERLGIGQSPLDPGEAMEIVESGKAVEGIQIEFYDEQRRRVPDGTVGEIGLSGNFLFKEYNKEPERTQSRLKEGVYFSNDLGFRHEGRIFVLGRKDDVIIINGRNLFAHEIEAALCRVIGLRPGRVVAVGVQNERTGSNDLIILAERDPHSAREEEVIRAEVVTLVYSIFTVQPKDVAIQRPGSLIKTTSGKISRSLNLTRYIGGQRPSQES
jgi:fatty-acyl-CoA synthase